MLSKRIIFASVIGNWVEWYNFLLFIYLEPVMMRLFFPEVSHFAAVTLILVLFAAGFLARPFGSLLFGFIGDRYGRQRALVWSIVALAAAACFMALMPTYQILGVVSPLLVVLCRVVQGLSAGGEHIGSAIYLVESAPAHRKALYASFAPATATLGVLSSSFAAYLLLNHMDAGQILAWGWRIPFAIGAIVSLCSIKLRLGLPETPVFQQLQNKYQSSWQILRQLFSDSQQVKNFFAVIILAICWAVIYNIIYLWLPGYLNHDLQLGNNIALAINTYCLILLIILLLIGGYVAGKIKPIKLVLLSAIALLLLSYPLFMLLASGSLVRIYFALAIFTVLIGCYIASTVVIVLQAFASAVRYTGSSLSFNISLAVFGGTAPLIASMLAHVAHNFLASAYYIMFTALLVIMISYRFRAIQV